MKSWFLDDFSVMLDTTNFEIKIYSGHRPDCDKVQKSIMDLPWRNP